MNSLTRIVATTNKPLRILVVDDCPEDREMYRRLLSRHDEQEYVFCDAATATEALQLCRHDEPDCILLDYLLPDIDGLQFLVELADLKGEDLIPVVVITGHGNEWVAAQAIKSGAQDYLVKDSLTQELICGAVRNAIQKVSLLRMIEDQRRELARTNDELLSVNRNLKDVSQLKSEFLANASHELRTPLNSILGFLRLVLDNMCASPEEERDFVQTSFDSARSLLELINNLLDISKMEAGKMTLDLEAVNLEKLFNDVYLLTHVQAQEKSLKLEFHAPEDGSTALRADYGKLKQILLNLVANALKFTDTGGITVRAIPVVERGFVTIDVVDTGVGIRPEIQSKLFGKFVQGDGSATRKHGGTGLGLTITKNLVELMGGVIQLESEGVGKGTRVWFTVPIYREDEEQAADWHQVAGQGTAVKGDPLQPLVLIAEDDLHFRRMLEDLAHQAGFSTVYALTADDTVMLARKMKPAAITLDHALLVPEHPVLTDGWDAYAALKTDAKTASIPVIFISGYDAYLEERLHAISPIKAPRLIAKPFTWEEFTQALSEAAESGSKSQGREQEGRTE